jgi:transposase-like protein
MIKPHFKPEFRQEVAELVVDKNYAIREAAESMGVGKSTVDKWARQLRQERNRDDVKALPILEERRRIRDLKREV